MLCRNPYMPGGTPFGCGQCLPCRINRRRQWTWRQYLESLMHESSIFVTLTYDDQHLPPNGELCPEHVQLFLKRLRSALSPAKLRYFFVGEYGPETLRPHYHASIFGMDVHQSALIWEAWGQGEPRFCPVYEFNELTAQYISGYVVKKLTDSTDPRLSGKFPEFARMSNRPGIGSSAMQLIAKQLSTPQGRSILTSTLDVPKSLKIGRRSIPLGRYLISQLRKFSGMTEDDITAAKMAIGEAQQVELSALFTDVGAVTQDERKEAFQKSIHQKILNTESRAAIFKKRNSL